MKRSAHRNKDLTAISRAVRAASAASRPRSLSAARTASTCRRRRGRGREQRGYISSWR